MVHIVSGRDDQDERERRYKLTICTCPEGIDHLPPRFGIHTLPSSSTAQTDAFCMKTHTQNCTGAAGRREFALDVLLVSRQIYQETVLRPFEQTTFSEMTEGPSSFHGLPAFLCDLVPAQAQAISHMRMVSIGGFHTQATIKQLKGLQHLDLLVVPWALDDDDYDHMRILHTFADQASIRVIRRLRSVRIAVEISVDSGAAVRKILRHVQAGSQAILQWLHDMEVYLLRPDVDFPVVIKMLDSDKDAFREYLAALDEQRDKVMGGTRGYSII